ncbi:MULTISPECIES: hypothetical protein [unclassified Paenibacillus]|uniref:hypothetical protein n=1 Tax=unclassified Paenibacillus TaxID=185978 RepID=UPI001AE3B9FA|nr:MULTISPECIES: hypothetical protein [unclassified Paenibacillus]MBP1154751.1 hypothetical protein [Paenibacillus sp. PvP091]MBP1169865.1 hypothetical protein [Paenibacillus sp. PvR098]MBP2440893.1 hypothetical protein [Paenibacillus sp. PvP052]
MSWTESFYRLAAKLAIHKPSLYPTEELDDLTDVKIAKLSLDGFEGERHSYALTVKAGLHLFNESLDPSYTISQDIHTPTGSYWHAIMHRMEGDYSNAKYWIRMAGVHPIYDDVAIEAFAYIRQSGLDDVQSELLKQQLEKWSSGKGYDPAQFVDLVEYQVTKANDEHGEELLRHIQWLEMRKLLHYGYVRSGGEGVLF